MEEESPTERVGSARISRHLALDVALRWTKPVDFTEILPFSGNTHQLAEHEGIDFINSNQSVDQVSVRSAANGKVAQLKPCEPAQSFKYVYDPAIHLGWNETYFSHRK